MSNSVENEGSTSDIVQEDVGVNVKHDWYQNEQQVVLQILEKNVDGSKVNIEFRPKSLDVSLLLNDGTMFKKTWNLSYEVMPERCFYKTSPLKIEIRLAKAEGNHWSELESKEVKKTINLVRNWDQVVKEINEETPQGSDALTALFQKIYAEGSDEVKKAMNKSFVESGGTELNTNWDSVKKERVSIKPPDGMEWKTWED